MATDHNWLQRRQCSLLLFVATPSEEDALRTIAEEHHIPFERIRDDTLGEYHWLGEIGNEMVIACRPVRERGRLVMGAHGRLGSAARAIRFRQATGAQAIVQLGMAFGIDRKSQQHGDVLVSSSLIPYDNRVVDPAARQALWLHRILRPKTPYVIDYTNADHQFSRQELQSLFRREQSRGHHSFGVHIGAILSGAARIHSRHFLDELLTGVPRSDDPIVGGEMEGIGLLSASTAPDEPAWCVVKGISDFADRESDREVRQFRETACRNAASFVLTALENDARRP